MPVGLRSDFNAGATIAALKKKSAAVDRITGVALKRAGLVVEREIKEELSKHGRHERGTPTLSPPGEAPSIITGALRASVRTSEPNRQGFASYAIEVGPTMVYSRVQELGGQAGRATLPARPYVAPAFQSSQERAQNEMVNYWRKAVFGG